MCISLIDLSTRRNIEETPFRRPRLGFVTLDVQRMSCSLFKFYWAFSLMRHTLKTYQLTFSLQTTGAYRSPVVEGDALVVIGNRVEQILHTTNTGGKCDTSCLPMTPGAYPATIGNQEEQHIQPIGFKKKVTTDSD